jgi:hypothetical protein
MAKGRKQSATEGEAQSRASLFVARPAAERSEGVWFARRYLMRSLEVFLYWMPVWVPLLLLAQIGTRGLKPAREEEQRLLRHEAELLERLERDQLEARELDDQREALDDEIYLERLRRQRQARQRAEIEARGLAPLPKPLPRGEVDPPR